MTKKITKCKHDSDIDWHGVEMEYDYDGTATVWQAGKCPDCLQQVVLFYNPGDIEVDDTWRPEPCPAVRPCSIVGNALVLWLDPSSVEITTR